MPWEHSDSKSDQRVAAILQSRPAPEEEDGDEEEEDLEDVDEEDDDADDEDDDSDDDDDDNGYSE